MSLQLKAGLQDFTQSRMYVHGMSQFLYPGTGRHKR